jgi:hypothetical protein
VTVPDERANGFGAEYNIAGTDRLTRRGKGTQSFGIRLDLLGLTPSKIRLDGMSDFLLHAAAVLSGSNAQGLIQVSGKTQRHGHTIMVANCTALHTSQGGEPGSTNPWL